MTETLARHFGVMAVVFESETGDDVPKMVGQLLPELPNLMFVVAEAESQPHSKELAFLACGVCAALVRLYFVLPLPEQGTRLMMRGFAIARRDGDAKQASKFIGGAIGQAWRSNYPRIPEEVESALDEFRSDDAVIGKYLSGLELWFQSKLQSPSFAVPLRMSTSRIARQIINQSSQHREKTSVPLCRKNTE